MALHIPTLDTAYGITVSPVCNTGDLGGYLGLLIGGSALTILEVADLVFYNALLKLMGLR